MTRPDRAIFFASPAHARTHTRDSAMLATRSTRPTRAILCVITMVTIRKFVTNIMDAVTAKKYNDDYDALIMDDCYWILHKLENLFPDDPTI